MLFLRPDVPATDARPLDPDARWAARCGELFARIAGAESQIARLHGEQVVAMAALVREAAAHAGDDETARDYGERSVRAELALVLRSSERFVEHRLDEAVDLTVRLPMTLAALRAGRITLYKAGILRDQTMHLSVEQCHEVERGLVPRAENLAPCNLRRAARRAVERIDRDAVRKRAKAARAERGVSLWESGDGMWTLHADLPAAPATGHLLDLGATRYAPSDRLAEFVRMRDQHCRFPSCRAPIDHSEIDHSIEFRIGGRTIRINVSLLCRRHHKIKHLPGWDLVQDPDGSGILTFRTPSGQTFRTRPPDLLTGEDPDPEDLTPKRPPLPDLPPF